MRKRKITKEDLAAFKFINDPWISPDGKQVIFTIKYIDQKKNRYISYLYMADVDDGEVRQFSFGDGKDSAPRWSPDGRQIAFLRVREGCSQIWLMSADSREARQVSHSVEGRPGPPVWSPDGRQIAFTFRPAHPDWTRKARKERKKKGLSDPARIITKRNYRAEGEGFLDLRQHIWICDIASGETRPVTNGDWDDRDPAWSPSGQYIAFVSNRSNDPDSHPFDEDIWLVSPKGGKPIKIKTPSGYKYNLSWSPDSSDIAYIGSKAGDDPWGTHNDRLWVVDARNQSGARCLTYSIDRTVKNVTLSDVRGSGNQNPAWSGNGKRIFFPVSDRGNCNLYSVDLAGKTRVEVGGNLDVSGFSCDPAGVRFALLISYPTRMAELFLTELNKANTSEMNIRRLTGFNHPLFEKIEIREPEETWFESPDGTAIQGWILKPPYFQTEVKYPLVLYIHGGPTAQYGNTFFHEFQVLAAGGYIVLYTNPRGSLGREEKFAAQIRGDWGKLDYQDLIAAVDYAEKLPFVDRKRMACAGWSYGGFMVTWIVGNTRRFRCAITEQGVSNRHSAAGTKDSPPMPDGYWQGNTWSRPEELWAHSPLRFADNIHTPLMIIHGEGDLRVPIGQAEQLFSALTALKRDVVFVRYPAEIHHAFSLNGPPDLRLDRLDRIVGWLDRHLAGSNP